MLANFKFNAIAIAFFALSSTTYAADYVYQTSQDPWANKTNDSAMSAVFGAANWSKSGYNIADFSGAKFVFLDGSDNNANELSSFIGGNQSFLENYVAGGGHLFINSAPNEGGTFSLGFGVTLNYDFAHQSTHSSVATINTAGVSAGLTYGDIATEYTGNFFSHATVTGPLTSLIDGSAGSIFSVMDWGSGFVAFGGQTTTNFHDPVVDARGLLANELAYVASVPFVTPLPIPEPEIYAMLLAGLGLLGFVARRRKESVI